MSIELRPWSLDCTGMASSMAAPLKKATSHGSTRRPVRSLICVASSLLLLLTSSSACSAAATDPVIFLTAGLGVL